ncbi:MAG: hypothetical protein PHF86_01565 [Candidatus Nanoarchaeia archaeon]|nr:hypothetical protein [Candidatus Nanoarchaeia archaeon]
MIIANITTYIGQDSEAEHYYCFYQESTSTKPSLFYNGSSFNKIDLKRKLTSSSEIRNLNLKDRTAKWEFGEMINRFLTIEQILNTLKEQFKGQDIITYYESKIFKEMLCILKGVDYGYKFFGEVWIPIPTSCWSNLLPERNTIKIKCGNCGTIHNFEDVIEEKEWDGKPLIQFYKKSEVDDPCCKYYDLEWNVIL